jgi:hypothetical protein
LANSSYTLAWIARKELPYTCAGSTRPGFELRCVISKHAELTELLAERERNEPLVRFTAAESATGTEE